jgi:phthiodiolone/phenolphthiodiolone dimycocerosates ketoreductase
VAGFGVGIQGPVFVSRPRAEAFTRTTYLSAALNRVDSFWVPDHLNGLFPRSLWQQKYCGAAKLVPSLDAYMEPWTMLGHLAARNRIGRLRLGVAVTDAGRRNPAVTAQAAATLNLLTRGRAILGIGPGEREGNQPYGVDWSRPVARFEEAIATIRALWDSRGELISRDSPYFPLRNALFDLPPYRGKWPEIWIAGHGPRMLRAVGRYADGFLPAFAQRPEDYAQRLETVRSAASDAGRDPMAIVPALWMPVITAASISPTRCTRATALDTRWDRTSPEARTSFRTTSTSRRRCPTSIRSHWRSSGMPRSTARRTTCSSKPCTGAITAFAIWCSRT